MLVKAFLTIYERFDDRLRKLNFGRLELRAYILSLEMIFLLGEKMRISIALRATLWHEMYVNW